MSKPKLISIMYSNYCKIVFIASFFGSYFLIPEEVFYSSSRFFAIVFLFVSAALITCLVRNFKERIFFSRTYKSSVIGVLATALGISSLQVCGLGAMCFAGAGFGFLSLAFPSLAFYVLEKYTVYVLIASIVIQLSTLYYSNCFHLDAKHDR